MNEVIIKYYRKLLKEDFPNAGELDNSSIFVEALGERIMHCGSANNYMQLYVRVVEGSITECKYLCVCNPVANVAVEILCDLVKGKTPDEAALIPEEAFYQYLGLRDEEFQEKVRGLLILLKEGVEEYTNAE